MAHYFQAHKQSGVIIAPWPLIKRKLKDTLAKSKRCVIAVFTEDEALSHRQIRWFKGILLPALSKETGDTKSYWETRLKMFVMPDEFEPEIIEYHGKNIVCIPSITKLSTKKMTELMDGSVEILHQWGFRWVTMPDSSLRKE